MVGSRALRRQRQRRAPVARSETKCAGKDANDNNSLRLLRLTCERANERSKERQKGKKTDTANAVSSSSPQRLNVYPLRLLVSVASARKLR